MSAGEGVEFGTFKGADVIKLPSGNPSYPFSFGVNKAKLVVKYIDEIKKFIDDQEKNIEDDK